MAAVCCSIMRIVSYRLLFLNNRIRQTSISNKVKLYLYNFEAEGGRNLFDVIAKRVSANGIMIDFN